MFPISDSIKSNKFPLITLLLIAINIFVFFLQATSGDPENFITRYALIPSLVNLSDPSTWFPFVTAMFLHGGIFHIASNMWFLWIFGDDVEGHLGKILFFVVYLLTGVAGNVLQFWFNPDSSIPMIGASGAVSGVLGAYYILFPHAKIKTVLFIFFFFTVIEIPAAVYLFYWFIIQLFQGAASTVNFASGGVAFWAHVGGFIAGVVFGKLFQSKGEKGYIEGQIVE